MSDHSTPSLVAAAANTLGIPESLVPENLVLAAEDESPKTYNVLIGNEPFSDPKWEHELGHLIKDLVVPSQTRSRKHSKHVERISSNLLQRISDNKQNKEVLHKAVLGLLALVHDDPKATLPEKFSPTLKQDVLKEYPRDVFLQAAVNKLLNDKEDLVELELMSKPFEYPPFQKALPYFPRYSVQVTLIIEEPLTQQVQSEIVGLIHTLNAKCKEIDIQHQDCSAQQHAMHAGYNVGFELNFWVQWCKLQGHTPSKPVIVADEHLQSEKNFMIQHQKLKYTSGHVWFYLKADTYKDCEELLQVVLKPIEDNSIPAIPLCTAAYKKNDGKLFGGRFQDGITSAVDAMSMIREVLIPTMEGEIDPNGGTFAFVQFFKFDKSAIEQCSQPVTENMIGRDGTYSENLARLDERCHIRRARIIRKSDGSNTELLRQAMPYVPTKGNEDRGPKSQGLFFVAFGQSIQNFIDILENILGKPRSAFTDDLFLNHVQGIFGKMFYCPNANEIDALQPFTDKDLYPRIPFWMKYCSSNPLMFYNHIQYLYTMTSNHYVAGDAPTKRILHLMSRTFARWHSTWYEKFDVPRLPHLKEFLTKEEEHIMDEPIQIRKGYSYKKMLGEVFTGKMYGRSENFDTYRIFPKELIVGVTDRLSFGSGKEVMPYLKEGRETAKSWTLALTEAGNMGHIVPGHHYELELGVQGILENLHSKAAQKHLKKDQQLFYRSAILAFEGVQLYLLKYAKLARETAEKMDPMTTQANDRKNLRDISKRMIRLAYGYPKEFTFHDAVQMVFSMHCCLHLVGQPVSIGRIDQLLIKFYEKDIKNGILKEDDKGRCVQAQEIIDAFFMKFDEHAVLNRYNIPYGHTTYGSTCVTGRGGPFPTGDSMNQWIQQITVGGCDSNGKGACNKVTLMCLKACRRLPLNAPCVSLRLTKDTPPEVKEEAALALLSGGAHPILFNDEKMVNGLYEVLHQSFVRSGLPDPPDLKQVARDYSCDGCYEPMFTGRSEFKFAYVFPLHAIIYTLNCGANYQPAGPLFLAGGVSSYRTALPEDIRTFDDFKNIFLKHLRLLVEGLYSTILNAYGNPWQICPSPLLSCLLEGCIESGKDMTNGGSRFHILTPMFVGFANTVNSLYNVKRMVYEADNVVTLETLRMALMNNWGEGMVEPFYDEVGVGTIHSQMWAQQFKDLRELALNLPKFGTDTAADDEELMDLAVWLASEMNKIAYEALYDEGPINDKYLELQKKHSVKGKPFVIQVMPGCGTFESYVSVGSSCAATPDGRLNGQPTASDCSPQPYPQDRAVPHAFPMDIIDTLRPYHDKKIDTYFPNGCEIDINIAEDFPKEQLMKLIDAFSKGETGTNLITVTCVDQLTMERAQNEPQKFDLVRNRMGGWSNFFVSMFDEHQKQHMRRPMFGPHKEDKT